MRYKLFIAMALGMAAAINVYAGNVSTELAPAKVQVPLEGEVRQRDIPRALFYEKERRVITPELLLTAGYLTQGDHPFGTVTSFQMADKQAATPGDKLYINKGSKDGVSAGDRFYIYHRSDEIDDPDSWWKTIGYIVSVSGLIIVEETKEDASLARVDTAYDLIVKGDAVMPAFDVKAPRMDPDRPLEEKNIDGIVAHVRHGKENITEDDVVYLNIGRKEGVREADIFKVLDYETERDEELHGIHKDIGRLQVISVRENTSTAIIINSIAEIKTGCKISYVQER